MPSVVNRHSRRITSVCSLLRSHLWPYSDASSCLIARRSVAFLPPWIKRVWKRCGACSCRTRWPARDQPRAWEVCGIGKDNDGWSSSLVGTRQAARQRALPQSPELPPAQRRLRPVCAPGYTGRKRGEVVRTRTTLLQAHTHQWERLAEQAMATTEESSCKGWRWWWRISAHRASCLLRPSFDSMAVWGRSHCRGSEGG